MSIDNATPDQWDALKADRHYDNRHYDIKNAECTLIKPPPEVPEGNYDWDRYAPSPDGYDSVEKPMHYEGTIECIDLIEDRLSKDELIGYYYGSVLKYAFRWKQKGGVESLRKCRWFLNRLITAEATGRFDG